MVFLGFIALLAYYSRRLQLIYWQREHSYNWKELAYSVEEMNDMDVTLGRYNNSFNFITGMSELPQHFDILNNPYIEYKAYSAKKSLTGSSNMEFDEVYELEVCAQEFVDQFIERSVQTWYEQPLCFKNRDQVRIINDWTYDYFDFPTINVVHCKNSTENDSWCKSIEDIDQFLSKHPEYFVRQETSYKDDMFDDSVNVQNFPHNGDEQNYFPTTITMLSYNYGPIKIDPTQQSSYVFEEIKFGKKELKINDKPLFYSLRTTEFFNVYNLREGIAS